MRLLLISSSFPSPAEPGKAIFNLRMAEALARTNDVRVIAPVPWVQEWRAGGVERRRDVDDIEIHHPRYYYPPKVMRSGYGWFFWRSIRATAEQLLAAQRPDLVLGYWAHPDGEAAVRAARLAGTPCVVMVGGSDVLLLTRNPGRRHRIESVLHAADAVITTSRHLRDALIELDIPAEKLHVVCRGVDGDRFCRGDHSEARRKLGMAAGDPVLLWVGRMVRVKGLDVLLSACMDLVRQGERFRLYLIGDGPLRAELKSDVARRGLSDVVSFVGSVAHEQLPDWYRAADLTVLPSRSEGLPNVLRESVACGTRFVASDVGGIREIEGADSCMLVPPGDAKALAQAILVMIARRETPALSARQLDWNESAEALMDVARSLVGAKRGLPVGCAR